MRLRPTHLTAAEQAFQREVSDWLDERLPSGSYELSLGMTGVSDPQFSRDLGTRGWLGMALSKEYGGGGRSAVERQIVAEQLLARGAPVMYHWVAERQMGPSIQAFGSEDQRRRYLPRIARGEMCFAIGMSEPDSGSDLASVRSRADRVAGGWRINGTKIWTTGASLATHILGIFRTSPDRHGGLSRFIVDTSSDGLTISPIPFIDGTDDFCEVSFDDVFVPDSELLGEVGGGWGQNTSELSLERGGVDRWMSFLPYLEHWLSGANGLDDVAREDLGLLIARLWGLRGLSLSISRMVDGGESPVVEAAMVKELATRFEQECVDVAARHLGHVPDLYSNDPYESLLARAILVNPSWTIRGGTSEILRTVVAKGLARR